MITYWLPTSFSMEVLTSPVKAPSSWSETFWAQSATTESTSNSAAAGNETNGGATTMSEISANSSAPGRKASRNSTVSAGPLFIFQFAAIMSFRSMILLLSGIRERCHPGQFLALQQFKGGSSPGRDEGDLAGETVLLDCRN